MISDYNFLPYFFTEPVYVIPEDSYQYSTTESIPEVNINHPHKKLPIRGNFAKQVLLVVDDTDEEVLNVSESEFLNRILKAVQLTEEDIIILNVHHITDEQLPAILANFPFKVLISFGVNSYSLLGTPTAVPYQIPKGQDKIRLLVDNLSSIENDKQKKIKLWENLQLLFVRG
jgi:hypothetical protein